jgi:hypothetical protein
MAFYWPVWLQGWSLPRGGGDLASFLWPSYRFASRTLWQGQIPLWNPHLYAGTPFAADNQMGLFYPVNWVAFLLGGPNLPYAALEGLVVFHTFWAGLGFYLFLRRLGHRAVGAWAGAVAFSLSDLFVTHLGNLNLNATASWLGWLLLALEGARRRSSWRAAGSAGLVLGLAALAGHGQIWLYLVLAGAVWAVVSTVLMRRPFPLAVMAIATVLAVGLAAVLLVPSYELLSQTARARFSWEESSRYALPLPALTGILWPDLWGRGPFFRASWERVEVGYAGAVTLVLALAALIGPWAFGRSAQSEDRPPLQPSLSLGVALLITGFGLALGRDLPFYRALTHLPGFQSMRAPARFVFIADAGLAILASYALTSLHKLRRALAAAAILGLIGLGALAAWAPVPLTERAVWGGAGIAAAIIAAGLLSATARRLPHVAALVLALLVSVELIAGGCTLEVDPVDPTADFFALPDVLTYLKRDPGFFRIDVAGGWPPDAALVHELYDMWGVYNPLTPASYAAYRWSIGARGDPLYDLLGVKYIVAPKGDPPGDERLIPVYDSSPSVDVYLNSGALPRVLLIHQAESAETFQEAWAFVHRPEFAPDREIVVEGGPPLSADPSGEPAHLALAAYDLHRVEVEVTTPQTGYLLLSDTWYPGWRAQVDDVAAPLYRADAAFRAVLVPPGEHRIRLDFRPFSWYIGLAVSVVTLGGLGWLAWHSSRPRFGTEE